MRSPTWCVRWHVCSTASLPRSPRREKPVRSSPRRSRLRPERLGLRLSEFLPFFTRDLGLPKQLSQQALADVASVRIRENHSLLSLGHVLMSAALLRPRKAGTAQVEYQICP